MSYQDVYAFDKSFALFANNLQDALKSYPKTKKSEVLALQKVQMEMLIGLESEWQLKLSETKYQKLVYEAFWDFIMNVKHNIALARVFFRERQTTFSHFLTDAFNNHDLKTLAKYHPNYQLIAFVMKTGIIKDPEIIEIANKIKNLRNKIIELNLPLAISRAKIFWSKTPEFHLSHMDLIQISTEGLISAIDKYVLPFSRSFRAVIIGRIAGLNIASYSGTLIHFYPVDKKKLYRANKLVHSYSIVPNKSIDFNGLSKAINENYQDNCKVTPEEVYNLLSSCASQFVELADKVLDDKKPKNIDNKISPDGKVKYSVISIDEKQFPENIVEKDLMHDSLKKASQELSVLERKIMRMYGIDI